VRGEVVSGGLGKGVWGRVFGWMGWICDGIFEGLPCGFWKNNIEGGSK